ncbi:MBL fold metallo-hydrolase [Bacillus wiedmannii]|uniref:MBL fold metallo-hydrolase n=1 Tax=Bacillus wiedmannii TaxID=1890302 RepID=UPI000BF5007F|nr:MBL fold metallo-hydrolase [Bacillus wiedmannii]PGD97843.1 MBL fold metallo-hydrolase [Bacillus wiedmannii]PHG78293.1 MBL fold metallo-hydrolase [Bacillus wiedmannii]
MLKTYEVIPLKVNKLNFINYSYLIIDKDTKYATIIDPAWDFKKIISTIENLDIILINILLTHSHFDHVNMVEPLLEKFNCQVYMSKKEIEFYHFNCKNLNELNHFDVIKVGSTEIQCLLTPGHTAGSACFLLEDSIFTGDTVFIEGCGICSGIGGSAEDMFESLKHIQRIVSPHVSVFPGHSYGKEPGYSLDYVKKQNIYFHLDKRESFVKFRMRKNQTSLFNFK